MVTIVWAKPYNKTWLNSLKWQINVVSIKLFRIKRSNLFQDEMQFQSW